MASLGSAAIASLPTSYAISAFSATQPTLPIISLGTMSVVPLFTASVTPKRYVRLAGVAVPIQ